MRCVKGCASSNISKSRQRPHLEASWLQFPHPRQCHPLSCPLFLSPEASFPLSALKSTNAFRSQQLRYSLRDLCGIFGNPLWLTPAQPVSTLSLEHCKTAWRGHSLLLPAAWQLPAPFWEISTPLSTALRLQCLPLKQLIPVCNLSNTCRTSFTREGLPETHTMHPVTSLQNSASYLPGSSMQLCSTISSSET